MYLWQDIDILDRQHRSVTKMIRGLGQLTYEERFMRCMWINTFWNRRTRET